MLFEVRVDSSTFPARKELNIEWYSLPTSVPMGHGRFLFSSDFRFTIPPRKVEGSICLREVY